MPGERSLDIVVFGATGFVGALVAGHLAAHAPDGVRVGLAGRSADRLAEVRDRLGVEWPVFVVDSSDDRALAELAASTRVVATTVGPYVRHGLPLVAACAAAGTDCVDLTGEVIFARQCIDSFDEAARRTGARIVNSCGFDSIPSDLGVLITADRAREDAAGDLRDTTLLVTSMRGGVSGGTVDSVRTQLAAMRGDKAVRRLVADPYALSPDRAREPDSGSERDSMAVRHDRELGWTGPFVMAGYNTRVVRRSNALQDWAYGRGFRYQERMGFGTGPVAPVAAGLVTGALGATVAGLSLAPSRAVLDRLLPKPGDGPSPEQRAKGRFRVEIHAVTSSGARYVGTVAAHGDPGYAATAVMMGESALCLVLERDRLPERAGILTPATGLGLPLVDRLRAQGFELSVSPV